MVKSVSHSLFLTNPPDEVWNLLTAFQRWSDWLSGVRHIAGGNENDIGRGSTLKIQAGKHHVQASIDHWEPGRKLQLSIHSGRNKARYSYDLEVKQNGTLLTIEIMPLAAGRLEYLRFCLFCNPVKKCKQQAAHLQRLAGAVGTI